ncbi:hypothetical protein FH972_024005 [Carpinus fangiana]|uniref:SET domain-containing protein n=1 Tax=Carpinus fangiana TaxID=176857 RepID=A0A5N6KXK8_9ROSI|nr:hypothetical protein FH972_024005 [Carpinus fangiana]
MSNAGKSTRISRMGEEGARHREFVKWACERRNVQINGVEPASFPGAGLGIVATRNIIADEALVFVPAAALITVPPDINELKAAGPISVHGRLALSLLERGAKAPEDKLSIAPWMTAMPSQADILPGMPVTWPPTLQELLPAGTSERLDIQQKNYQRDLTAYLDHLRTSQPHSSPARLDEAKKAYTRAWLLINSRTFYWDYPPTSSIHLGSKRSRPLRKKNRPRDDCMALCPFLDYFNHVSGSACAQVEFNATGFTARADRSYAAGEEINISYGAHSNDYLLAEYGFVMGDEPANDSDFALLDDYVLPLLDDMQRGRLRDKGLLSKFVMDRDGSVCFRTECALNLLVLSTGQWEKFVIGETGDNAPQKSKYEKILRERVLAVCIEHAKEQLKKVQSIGVVVEGSELEFPEREAGELKSREWDYAKAVLKTRWEQIALMAERGVESAGGG